MIHVFAGKYNSKGSTIHNNPTAPGMECSFNNTKGLSRNGMCNRYPSKLKYSSIAVGNINSTEFEWYYIDLRNDIESYPNQIFEGAIRPPVATRLAILSPFLSAPNETIHLSMQIDTMLYKCSYNPSSGGQESPFCGGEDILEAVICPELDSRYWISIYNDASTPNGTFPVGAIAWFDETGQSEETDGQGHGWGVDNFCLEPGALASSEVYNGTVNGSCDNYFPGYTRVAVDAFSGDGGEGGSEETGALYVGGYNDLDGYYTNLAAVIWPPCYRSYYNQWGPFVAEVLNGMFVLCVLDVLIWF